MEKHQVLIIGGGNAGISVAAQLLRKRPKLDIAIVEPSDKHYYQPAWTLVAGAIMMRTTRCARRHR
jgi:sulfide:quinone oxidoreductase